MNSNAKYCWKVHFFFLYVVFFPCRFLKIIFFTTLEPGYFSIVLFFFFFLVSRILVVSSFHTQMGFNINFNILFSRCVCVSGCEWERRREREERKIKKVSYFYMKYHNHFFGFLSLFYSLTFYSLKVPLTFNACLV